jgi:glyoxylase-like metal-dependent hydrolase (beta-lactamase superfamily II)
MGKLLRWVLVLVLLAGGYYWLVLDSRMPADASYAFDINEVRKLAESVPGAKPTQLRYEHVYTTRFTKGMIVTGDGWSAAEMPVYSYQLIYPDRSVIVDTAMDRAIAGPDFLVPYYDVTAWQRMLKAMDTASQVVITHEHMDHIGGIAAHPNLKLLLPNILLTKEQLAHPSRMWPATLPEGVFDDYEPLVYEQYLAIAPGLVLIKSPGHTPGSQMVFVRLADGREILLLGDVVWKMRNIELQRERPRWVTALLVREDRDAVFGQIKALGELAQREPGLRIVPGHDGSVVDALTAAGYLQKGFK